MYLDSTFGVFLFVLIIGIIGTFIAFRPEKSENISNALLSNDKSLDFIKNLARKVEDLEIKVKINDNKISALQLSSSIDREQSKFLTSNVNKTLS
tara:strand:- start:6586 stop:6870 length:285 start_codon:yes stop_codon:yes gene_type:complete